MPDYVWWEDPSLVPGRSRRDTMAFAYYEQLVVTHAVALIDGEPDSRTACGRAVPFDAALQEWVSPRAQCRVCRRKMREFFTEW